MKQSHVASMKAVRTVLDLVASEIEPRARKAVFLVSKDGHMKLTFAVVKKKEKEDTESPMVTASFDVDGHADGDFTLPLSKTMLEGMKSLSVEEESLVFEITDRHVKISGNGEHQETYGPAQGVPDESPRLFLSYGTYSSSQLAHAMRSVALASGIVPEPSNSTAIQGDGAYLNFTAGEETRRAFQRLENGTKPKGTLEALCPPFFVAPLIDFLRNVDDWVELCFDSQNLSIEHERFEIVIHRHTDFVIKEAPLPVSDGQGGVLFRLNPSHTQSLLRLADMVSSYDRSALLKLAPFEDGVLAQPGFSDEVELNFHLPVEKVAGTNGCTIEVAAEDFSRALESVRIQAGRDQRVDVETDSSVSVSVKRQGDLNYRFDVAQMERQRHQLRSRIDIYAAVSGQYNLIRKTQCRRVLLSHYALPPSVKDNPHMSSARFSKSTAWPTRTS